ncbi:MAG TPA: hypothetical protein VF765_18020 [Polyangiaceae bacterium]
MGRSGFRVLQVAAFGLVACSRPSGGEPASHSSAEVPEAAVTPEREASAAFADASLATLTADAAKQGPSTAVVNGRAQAARSTFELREGVAYVDALQLHVWLSDVRLRCGETIPEAAHTLHVQIPAGPGRRYFLGGVIGLTVFLGGPGVPETANADGDGESIVEVTGVAARVRGSVRARAKRVGALDGGEFTYPVEVHASFDMEICDGQLALERTRGLPDQAPAGPFGGTLANASFQPKAAVAIVENNSLGRPAVREIAFFPDGDPGCDLLASAWERGSHFALVNVNGGIPSSAYRGPQIADGRSEVAASDGGRSSTVSFGDFYDAWVQFEEVQLAPGGHVKGAAVAWTADDTPIEHAGHLGGRFDARVCLVP